MHLHKSVLAIIAFVPSALSLGQTTVFSDNFNRASLGSSWTTTTTAGDGGASIVSSDVLRLTNDSSATANANGIVYSTVAISSFSAPFNAQLNSNSTAISWYLNFQVNRANLAGLGSGSYGAAFVLAGSNGVLPTAGSGYAIVLGNSSTPDPFRLVRYTNGLSSVTNLISSNTTGVSDIGTKYYSLKVTYTPTTNQWELFVRDDGASAFTLPTSGSLTSQGTATDNTYGSLTMTAMGAYWSYSTAATQFLNIDNVSVDLAATPIPEPSTYAAMAGVAALLGVMLHRRRQQQAAKA